MKLVGFWSHFSWRVIAPTVIVLAIGIILSFSSFFWVISQNREHFREMLDKTASRESEVISHTVDLNITALQSIRGLFHASSSVTRQEFEIFVWPMFKSLPGVQALEWIPRVSHENRRIYEQLAQQDGIHSFTISEREAGGKLVPASIRDEYFPVYYAEPLKQNKVALGFDLGSNDKRLNALRLSRETGKPVATAPITLVQESGDQQAFLVFVPIYESNPPTETVDARRGNILGFSLGVYRVGDMIEATLKKLGSPDELNFYIFDASDVADIQLMYRGGASPDSGEQIEYADLIRDGLHTTRTLDVAGRIWEIVFKPGRESVSSPVDTTAILVLLTGLAFSGLFAAYVWTALQRTERVEQLVGEQTQKLMDAYQELKRSNEDLQQFATIASHDLQEPLRNLQAFCGLLQSEYGDQIDETASDYVSRIHASSQRMETLIRGLLSFSRISSKGDNFAPVDLNEVVKEVVVDLDRQIDQSSAQIVVGDLPVIDADSLQIHQLLQNLIGNAVKYRSPAVAPVIKIDVCQGDGSVTDAERDSSDWIQLIIQDNGIGFDQKYAARIFGIFQRLHGRNEYDGTGVGLAICQKIVSRHGGRIEANSKIGEGATFTIILPRTQTKSR